MAWQLNDTLRATRSQAVIDFAGASAKLKFMSGTQPAAGGAETTILGTLNFSTVIGTTTTGVLTFGAVTQTNSSHVSGTPTWARLTKSDNTWVADFAIPGDLTFTGSIATGVDIALGACTITEGQ